MQTLALRNGVSYEMTRSPSSESMNMMSPQASYELTRVELFAVEAAHALQCGREEWVIALMQAMLDLNVTGTRTLCRLSGGSSKESDLIQQLSVYWETEFPRLGEGSSSPFIHPATSTADSGGGGGGDSGGAGVRAWVWAGRRAYDERMDRSITGDDAPAALLSAMRSRYGDDEWWRPSGHRDAVKRSSASSTGVTVSVDQLDDVADAHHTAAQWAHDLEASMLTDEQSGPPHAYDQDSHHHDGDSSSAETQEAEYVYSIKHGHRIRMTKLDTASAYKKILSQMKVLHCIALCDLICLSTLLM